MKLGLNKNQSIILGVMAVLDLLVVAGLGGVIISQAVRAKPTPTAIPPTALIAQVTSTPRPPTQTPEPAPPTWTPRPTQTPEGYSEPYAFATTECSFEIPVEANVDCGFVAVPEDRSGDPADTIKLAVAVYHSTSDSPAPDPVIYLSGGPGGPAVEDIVNIHETYITPILDERDFIVFDQRGTGLSEPKLDCPEYDAVYLDDLEKNYTHDEKAERYERALQRCRDRLVSLGANLAAYTSVASSDDVKDILSALGYDQVNLYGGSYGTRLALTIMRDHPEIVRSAVLDSVVPVETALYNEQAAKVERAFNEVFDGCAADPVCRRSYPDLEDMYYETVDLLDYAPVPLWASNPFDNGLYKVTVNGLQFTRVIFFSLYYTELIPYIPLMIYETYNGYYDILGNFLSTPFSVEGTNSIGMMLSVNCHEEVYATTPEQIAADYAAHPKTEAFANEAVYGDPRTQFSICEAWGAAPFDPLEGEPVVSDIPALIIAGEYDPATPPSFGLQVADNLSRSYYFEFPGEGHGPSIAEGCAFDIALAFLTDPNREPDASCIADMDGPDFVSPY